MARNEPRGRHAKPPTKAAVTGERILTTALSERHRGRLLAVGGGTLSATMLALVVMVGLSGGGTEPAKATAADVQARSKATATKAEAGAKPAGLVNPSPATEPDTDQDLQAIAFMKQQDPNEKVLKHVKEVRQIGDFLRVYTDLPEEDENSDQAVSLCKWATEYLKSTQAEVTPLVFIHAKESGNGHVVLANKDSAKDNCKVGETR